MLNHEALQMVQLFIVFAGMQVCTIIETSQRAAVDNAKFHPDE